MARIAVAMALVLSVLTATPSARAEPRRGVALSIRGADEPSRLLSATIRELLARVPLDTAPGPHDDLLVTVEIDLDEATGAHVVVRSRAGAVVLDRPVRDANPAIEREQIAHAVRGAAEAELLAEQDRRSDVPAPAPEAERATPNEAEPASVSRRDSIESVAKIANVPPPRPPGEARGGLALDVSSFVAGGPVASTAGPVVRVGGAAALALRRGLRPSIALSALYAFPFEAGNDVLGSRTHLVSGRVLAGFELLRTRGFAWELGGGGGIDVIGVEPTSNVLPISAMREATSRVDPIASFAMTGRVAVASDVTLTVSAVLDADFVARRYVFEERGLRGDILAPWLVRPLLQVGFSFTAFGEPSFAASPSPAHGSASR